MTSLIYASNGSLVYASSGFCLFLIAFVGYAVHLYLKPSGYMSDISSIKNLDMYLNKKLASKPQKSGRPYHGGCAGCIQPNSVCRNCAYMKAEWNKPKLAKYTESGRTMEERYKHRACIKCIQPIQVCANCVYNIGFVEGSQILSKYKPIYTTSKKPDTKSARAIKIIMNQDNLAW
jgi:hypothetical protein